MSTTNEARSDEAHRVDAELPKVFDLLSESIDDLKNAFAEYLLAGLGLLLVVIPVVFVGMALMFGGMVPGMLAEDELLLIGGMALGTAAYMALLIGVTAPLNASIMRSVNARLEDGSPLTIGSSFSRATEDLPAVLAYTVVMTGLVLVGMVFCYVPGLLVALFTGFGLPAIVVHRLRPLEALSLSATHAREHFTWHLGFWGLGFAIAMVSQNIPVVGPMIGAPLYASYQLRAYRKIFGTGERPRGW